MTDELNVYHALHMGYKHDMIRHSVNVYVKGKVTDGHRSQMMVFGAEGKRLTYKQPARES